MVSLAMDKRKDVLTTGQVAKICNVAPRTVSKWFDSGQLRGYRIPGSKDRRIPLGQLVRFMRAHNIPLKLFSLTISTRWLWMFRERDTTYKYYTLEELLKTYPDDERVIMLLDYLS